MYKYESRVKVSTSTTGDGWTVALGAAESGFQSFADAGYKEGDSFPYAIEDDNGNWEVGVGVYKFNLLGLEEDSSTLTDITSFGTKTLQISDSGDKLFYYDGLYVHSKTFSTAWDASTIQTGSTTLNVGTPIYWIQFGNSGAKLYVAQNTNIKQYSLSTAFDLSTASLEGTFTWPTDIDDFVTYYYTPISWSNDGTKIFIYGKTEDTYSDIEKQDNSYFVTIATVSTAWDLTSTIDYDADLMWNYAGISGARGYDLGYLQQGRFFNDLSIGIMTPNDALQLANVSQFRLDKTDVKTLENTHNVVTLHEKVSNPVHNFTYQAFYDAILAKNGEKLYTIHPHPTTAPSSTGSASYYIVQFSTNNQFNQTTMTRKVLSSSNNNNRINLSGSAKVFVTPNQFDFTPVVQGTVNTTINQAIDVHELDLSTGTFFVPKQNELVKDCMVTLKNIPEHGMPLIFSCKIPSPTSSKYRAFDAMTYNSVSFTVPSASRDFKWKPDGTKFYIVQDTTNACSIFTYYCSTAWDISTASYSRTDSLGSNVRAWGLHFKPDGTKVYVTGYTDEKVYQYDMSTAWDLSTMSHSNTLNGNDIYGNTVGISLSPDGTKLCVMYSQRGSGTAWGGARVDYILTTAWDLSTATFQGVMSTTGYGAYAYGLYITEDGYKMYYGSNYNDEIFENVLMEPYGGSTSSATNPAYNFQKTIYDHSGEDTGNIRGVNAQHPKKFFALISTGLYEYDYYKSRPARIYFKNHYGENLYETNYPSSGGGTYSDIFTFIKFPNSKEFVITKTAINPNTDKGGPQD